GHHFGDKYLAEISKKIARHLRDCDQIARYGGDEFLVLMSSVRDEAHCISLIEQFLKKMEPFQTIEGIDLTPQLSIGIALYPDDGKTYEELLKKADSAMYKAKKKSGNNYSF